MAEKYGVDSREHAHGLVSVGEHAVERMPHGEEAKPTTRSHGVHVVAWCTKGSGIMLTPQAYAISPGVLYLLPAGMPHRLSEANDIALKHISFCPACLRRDGMQDLLAPFDRARDGAALAMKITDETLGRLTTLFQQLKRACSTQDNLGRRAQTAALTLLLVEVARVSARQSLLHHTQSDFLTETMRLIETHCLESISMSDIATMMHMTPAHLTTRLRRETGFTAQTWIITFRMTEARRLLSQTDEGVDIITERVGYSDVTHFIRMFKRQHDMTPAAWRAAHKALKTSI